MVEYVKEDTFAAVIHAYLASPKFAALADNTRSAYRFLLGLAERRETLGAIPVETLRPSLVQAFLDGLSDRPGTQKNALVALRAVEKWAIQRDLLVNHITFGAEVIDSDGGHEPWTDEQVRIAETKASPYLARVITMAANTGQRGSDLVKMRWSEIETYQGRPGINVIQKKTGMKIWIPFTQELMAAIAHWHRHPGFILLNASGQPWTRELLSTQWLRARQHIHELKECVLHGLRATAVVRLRRAGATTGQIKDMVGMSEQTVNRYCRHSVQRENAIAAVHYLDRTAKPLITPAIDSLVRSEKT